MSERTDRGTTRAGWDGPYSLRYTLWVLFLALLVSSFNTLDRTIVSILVEHIKAEFSLTDTQLGALMGPAFAIVYAFLVLPISRLADVWVRRTIVSVSLFVWSLFTAAAAITTTFGQLFAARMGVGVGEADAAGPLEFSVARDGDADTGDVVLAHHVGERRRLDGVAFDDDGRLDVLEDRREVGLGGVGRLCVGRARCGRAPRR